MTKFLQQRQDMFRISCYSERNSRTIPLNIAVLLYAFVIVHQDCVTIRRNQANRVCF